MEVATGKPAAPEPKPGSTLRQGTPTLPSHSDQKMYMTFPERVEARASDL